jgi:hypothetical protein
MKPLIYPFTYKEWLKHPSTKPKLKMIKEDWKRWRKFENQLEINFELITM